MLRFSSLIILAAILFLPTAVGLQAQTVDSSTLSGHVLCGYQGWFACPGDGNTDLGWQHWSQGGFSIGKDLYNTDVWPDVTEFKSEDLFPCGPSVVLTQGGAAYLPSPRRQGVTDTHFRWMQENNIDGVYLQRFSGGLGNPYGAGQQHKDAVLQNVMRSAVTYGRTFCIEYDLSGTSDSEMFDKLTNDWTYLNNTFGVSSNPRYQHHNGKPVVCLWGLVHDRPYTVANAMLVINWFKDHGVFLMVGTGGDWRSQGEPWYSVYRSFNAIQPWSVGAYNSWADINGWMANIWGPDIDDCYAHGILYVPVAWPRFGWDNANHLTCGQSKFGTRGGQHIWDQFYAQKTAFNRHTSMVVTHKIAMFDEADESTAILKMSDNVPVTGCWWTSEGLPHDWYLRLVDWGAKMMRGDISLSQTMPISPTSLPDNATIVSNTIPSTMAPGQQYSVSVTVQNTGETCWNAEFFKLKAVGDSDPFTTTVQAMGAGQTVTPNGQYTFSLTMKAPPHNGVYVTDWQMSHELIRWFGAKLSKLITVGSGAQLSAASAFAATTDGWTTSTWRASTTGSYGTIGWYSTLGNPAGSIRCYGASTTDNTDRCSREGGEIQKTISTVGCQGIVISYDLNVNALGNNNTGAGTGSCQVDHNLIDEQLTVYYSTNGGSTWTEADTVARTELKASYQSAWGTRLINLAGVSACNDNPGFRVRFRWQLNTSGDMGYLDNIKVYANQIDITPPGNLASFAATGGNQQVALSWTNPADADYTGAVVRYRTDTYPTNLSDGELLADKPGAPGAADGCIHTGLTNGRTYYYTAFAHDDAPLYASSATTSGVTNGVVEDWIIEPFDNYANGFLAGLKWTTVAQSCAMVESSVVKGGAGKATMADAVNSWGPIGSQISFTDKSAGYCYLTFDVAQDAAGTTGSEMGSVTVYGSDSPTEVARVHMQKGRLMVEYGAGSFAILTASASNLTWYTVKIGLNIDTRRMDFWLDGIVKGTGYDWKGTATSLSRIVISSDRNVDMTIQKVYIDNLKLEPKLGQVAEVRDDGVWTPGLSKLHFNFDPAAFTSQYRYCIGTTSGGSQTRGWTVCGISTDVTATGLTLVENQSYYVTVQCGDANGNWGASRTSDGIRVAPGLATIPAAKALPDSSTVYALRGELVSAKFSGCFYIQEPNAPFGIKVVSTAAVNPGDQVDVAGAVSGSGAERLIDCTGNGVLSTTPGPGGPNAVVISTASVGGVDLNTYTPGVAGGTSANNIGLYVTICGQVTQRQTTAPMYFYIDDGCGLRDGTTTGSVENVGVRIPGDPATYAEGSYVMVTGISSCFSDNGSLKRQLLPTAVTTLKP